MVGALVTYNSLDWIIAEIGEDGSMVLTPYLQSGPNRVVPGELELSPEEAKSVRIA